MSRREFLRAGVFLLLCLLLTLGSWMILDRKAVCDYTVKVNGFFNEQPESMDLIGYGSSRMYCTLDPVVVRHETGLNAYVLATQQQPLAATYYYMKESLRTQHPRFLVLEATMAFQEPGFLGNGALRDCLDPLPWSKNKAEIIRELVPRGERSSYYFNFLEYHQRWQELSAADFNFDWVDSRDVFRGYIYLTPERGADCRRQSLDAVQAVPIAEENLELIRRMKTLAEENGAELILLVSSYELVTDDLGRLKSLHTFCEEEGLPLLDMNEHFDELELDTARDYFDINHFNVRGSTKASRWICRWLEARYDLAPRSGEPDRETEAVYEEYIAPLGLA